MSNIVSHRLPDTVRPERYQIRLAPDLKAFTFSGEETVSLTILAPVSEIILNACELAIHTVTIANDLGGAIAGAASLDETNERAILRFPRILGAGAWKLSLAFSGILNDKLHGFYRSAYKDAAGRSRTLATTQFESTDARRAFPCWDEPACKAVFQVTLVVDKDLTVISNTAVARETPGPDANTKVVVFADTIRMSTYLVACIIGEFVSSEPVMVDGVALRVWTVPGKQRLTAFALDIGAASLAFFNRYYGRPYPGDKLDLIAIPDFASGAMENLGAITFRETALLVDTKTASRSELERVADVVAHENAHMWFGDLVTMRWWNSVWLNEAFATFMEMLAVDAWKPEWQRWDGFAASRAAALLVDGLKSTRAVEFPVQRPEEAAAMFDVLTYEKGGAVLRMLEQYLGPETFRKGVVHFLRRHEYDNAETTDLWDAIEESAQQPVRTLMDSWIFQPGYPLITARLEGQTLFLSQQIFQYLADGADDARRWQTPLFLRISVAGKRHDQVVLLTDREMRIELPGAPDWVLVNGGGYGFYRVRYDAPLLEQLTRHLDKLLPVERLTLIHDAWAVALSGRVPLATVIAMWRHFRLEDDPNIWTAIISMCHYVNRVLDPHQRPKLQAFVRELAGPLHARLGWSPKPGESDLISQLRGDAIAALGTLGNDASTQAEARARYAAYKTDPRAVDPNVLPALVAIMAHTGGAAEYEDFRKRSKEAHTPQEEQRYQFALASFRQPELIARTLAMTLDGEIRTQNAPYLIRSMLFNTEARERAWEFIKANWDDMNRKYPDNSIVRMCEGIMTLVTPALEADVNAFFAAHPVKQADRTLRQHIEKLRIAVACQQREAANLDGKIFAG